MTRSAVAPRAEVCISPALMASSETITATTQATPMRVTSEELSRCGRLRMFMPVTAMICFSIEFLPAPCSPPRQSVDDLQPHGADGGRQAGQYGQHHRRH